MYAHISIQKLHIYIYIYYNIWVKTLVVNLKIAGKRMIMQVQWIKIGF